MTFPPQHPSLGEPYDPDDPEGERQAEGKRKARQVEHARVTGIKRTPDGRDAVGNRIQMHGPENPGVWIGRWK